MSLRDFTPDVPHTSHRHRCIFVHVPKAAGTSIKQALGMPGGGHWPWHYYADFYPEYWQTYRTFTVVRNPWDRLVSAYRFAQMKRSYWHDDAVGPPVDFPLLVGKSFAECLEILETDRERLRGEAWHPQTAWVAGPRSGGKVMVEHVLRYESLDRDFAELCRELEIAAEPLLTLNRSSRARDYRSYYDERSRRLVERLYAADVEAFGYAF